MLNLLWKDIQFNKKQILIGILSALFFSSIILDGQKYSFVGVLMIPSLLFTFMVGKMCHVEDQKSVAHFLSSLPIKKSEIVMSKYIMSYMSLSVGILIMVSVNFVAHFFIPAYYDVFSSVSLTIMAFVIVYNSIYLYLNFKLSYAHAQQTVYVLLFMMIFCFSIFGKYKKYVPFDLSGQSIIGWVALTMSIIFSFVMMQLTIRAYEYKE